MFFKDPNKKYRRAEVNSTLILGILRERKIPMRILAEEVGISRTYLTYILRNQTDWIAEDHIKTVCRVLALKEEIAFPTRDKPREEEKEEECW